MVVDDSLKNYSEETWNRQHRNIRERYSENHLQNRGETNKNKKVN